ncbi:MAG TPA: DUF2142 domain-containing protein [Thermoanaerobaculia bacterium]|nr:DUF2142 domain-containing protein [Thermoanaerobaculia bacterium]
MPVEPEKSSARQGPSVEWFFLLASLFAGLLLTVVTPPFQVADEYLHFFRAYAISEGALVPRVTSAGPADLLPRSIFEVSQHFDRVRFHPEEMVTIEEIRKVGQIPLAARNRQLVAFRGAGVYSAVPYFPQAFGIAIGRLFGSGALGLLYFGRVANLIVSSIIILLAIRVAPLGRWVFAMLALTPMSNFQRASVSPDALTIAVCFFFIAWTLRIALSDEDITGRSFAVLLTSMMIVLACKPNFLPLLILTIPVARVGRGRRLFIGSVLVLLVCGLTLLEMSHLARKYFEPAREGTNAALQASKIEANPLGFLGVVYEDLCWQGNRYSREFFGTLGWLDAPLSDFVAPLLCATIVLLAIFDGPLGLSFRDWQRLLILAIVIFSTVALSMALYISFTRPASSHIDGLQGRYWIPFSPLIFLLARSSRFTLDRMGWRIHALAASIFLLTLWDSVWRLLDRYYETMPWS